MFVLQILVFQRGFKDEERRKLAIVTGQILANGLASPRVLAALFEDHLVKEGQHLLNSNFHYIFSPGPNAFFLKKKNLFPKFT